MLTIEQVREKLKPMNLKHVSRDANMEYMQIWKLLNNKYASVPYDVVKQLSDYLESL